MHRDLKPENILRTTDGTLKILDFGLAQFDEAARDLVSMTRLTQPGLVAGTPPYMAPEQLLGRDDRLSRPINLRSASLLYELRTGRHPFGGQSLPSTIAHILAASRIRRARDDAIPTEVWQIIDRCLQKDPAQRFESTRELLGALEGARVAFAGIAPGAAAAPDALRHLRTCGTCGTCGTHAAPEALASPAATAAPAPAAPAAPAAPSVWWWRFHQFAAALRLLGDGLAGLARASLLRTCRAVLLLRDPRRRRRRRQSALAPVVFVARVSGGSGGAASRDVARWIRAADIAFAALLIIGGIALARGARRLGGAVHFVWDWIGARVRSSSSPPRASGVPGPVNRLVGAHRVDGEHVICK